MTKSELLDSVANGVSQCEGCDLCKSRINPVMHRGNPNAELVFCGEAPGYWEDVNGEPFVGRSGKLLDSMIEAMGYGCDDVYICNICKCRPPNNRKPTPQEMDTCKPFLIKQLDIVKPKAIVALGATAMEGLLGRGEGITKRRGKWDKYNDIPTMATFHPACCLRNPASKQDVWKDLREVLILLGKIKD